MQEPDTSVRSVPEAVNMIIHNVRQNLANIRSVSELLKELTNNPVQTEVNISVADLWVTLQRNTDAAVYELMSLIEWFQIPNATPIDMGKALHAVVDSLGASADARQVQLVSRIPDIPMLVLGFESALHRLLRIPIMLAIYSLDIDSQIQIELRSEENTVVYVVSTDDVVGIPTDLSLGAYSSIPEYPELRSGMWTVRAIAEQIGGVGDYGLFNKNNRMYRIKLPAFNTGTPS
jgi:signal transduction histidine kinase